MGVFSHGADSGGSAASMFREKLILVLSGDARKQGRVNKGFSQANAVSQRGAA
jgi:hypothetical protein